MDRDKAKKQIDELEEDGYNISEYLNALVDEVIVEERRIAQKEMLNEIYHAGSPNGTYMNALSMIEKLKEK